MISKYNHQKLAWIDLENPKNEEISYIFEEYSIPKIIRDRIKINKIEAKIDQIDDYIIVYLNFPIIEKKSEQDNQLICIINDEFIITIHDKYISPLIEFKKDLELNIITEGEMKIDNNKVLFIYLLKDLFLNLKNHLYVEKRNIKKLETQIKLSNKKVKLYKTLFFILFGVIIILSLYVIIFI